MTRKHGRRPHIAVACGCRSKMCFTTWDAAMAAVKRVPDAVRAFRSGCCGHYHITRYTVDEYAQRVADFGVQDAEDYGTVVPSDNERTGHGDQTWCEPGAGDEPHDAGPTPGGPGAQAVERRQGPRLPPSPATLAQRLQARGHSGAVT